MPHYCDIAPDHPVHSGYHDSEYGFPTADETALFERLSLEIMQAGLSWEIVLKKRAALKEAFDDFAVDKVARYGEAEISRLLADARIIRNRRKIEAVIANAATIAAMRGSHRGFDGWLKAHHPRPKSDWIRLFRRTFRFTGGEITGEFLTSLGYLPDAHRKDCYVYERIIAQKPPWLGV